MKGYNANIEELTVANDNFRKVEYTGKYMQLVLMSLAPGEEIGAEVHDDGDQFFRFEAGEGVVVIDSSRYEVEDGSSIVVPAGANHNVINTSQTETLKLYTIYSPPHHQEGTVRATREEAEASHPHFDGTTTE